MAFCVAFAQGVNDDEEHSVIALDFEKKSLL